MPLASANAGREICLTTRHGKERALARPFALALGLASEASFGPHPAVPMLAVGQELLLFVDLDRGLHLLEQRLDWRTNYAQKLLEPDEDPRPG